MTDTVRELAIQALVTLMEDIRAGYPISDPYPMQFDVVQRNPLDEESWKRRLSLGVHDTLENVSDGMNQRECYLTIVMEFRRVLDTGEVASKVGGEILGVIQRRFNEDNTLNGTVINIEEQHNELYIENFNQRQLSGALWFQLHYRTGPIDPRVNRF